jgi:malonate-semialdehyde dehydrogenase (acetylating)/methylmalonate-semialdehyde dehydrogenase
MKTLGHWINGEHVSSTTARTSPVFNPATGVEQAQLQLATPEQVNDVVAAAKLAFVSWGN